jgi:hypothetical protein
MKCPHCSVEFHDQSHTVYVGRDIEGEWGLVVRTCPSCDRLVINLSQGAVVGVSTSRGQFVFSAAEDGELIRPRGIARSPVPLSVPSDLAQDYREACLVLADSPKASAALSRRCLQHLLGEKGGTTEKDLAGQIEKVLGSKQLPPYLAEDLDVVRNIGNFAAHVQKSTITGAIMDVEPGEAEWNLDVLEALFDFYFVQHAASQAKRDALNSRLKEAGKPPMKSTQASRHG